MLLSTKVKSPTVQRGEVGWMYSTPFVEMQHTPTPFP